MPNLTTLTIDYADSLTDLTVLSNLPNLTTLTIDAWAYDYYTPSITSLTGLSELPNLTYLTIKGAQLLTDIIAPSRNNLNLTTQNYLKKHLVINRYFCTSRTKEPDLPPSKRCTSITDNQITLLKQALQTLKLIFRLLRCS